MPLCHVLRAVLVHTVGAICCYKCFFSFFFFSFYLLYLPIAEYCDRCHPSIISDQENNEAEMPLCHVTTIVHTVGAICCYKRFFSFSFLFIYFISP